MAMSAITRGLPDIARSNSRLHLSRDPCLQVILVLAPARDARREKCRRRLAGPSWNWGNDHLGVSIVMGVPQILDSMDWFKGKFEPETRVIFPLNMGLSCKYTHIPSGELTFCYGKSPFFMGKSTISTGPFSIAFCMFTRGYPKYWRVFVRENPKRKWMTGGTPMTRVGNLHVLAKVIEDPQSSLSMMIWSYLQDFRNLHVEDIGTSHDLSFKNGGFFNGFNEEKWGYHGDMMKNSHLASIWEIIYESSIPDCNGYSQLCFCKNHATSHDFGCLWILPTLLHWPSLCRSWVYQWESCPSKPLHF